MNKKEAVAQFVESEINSIDQGIIRKLVELEPEAWHEVTYPSVGDRVYIYDTEESGEIESYDFDEKKYTVETDDGTIRKVSLNELDREIDYALPMWETMWSFKARGVDYFLKYEDGIRKMSECGFRIYENEEFGYFFGIDGAGYDFYEAHWEPLYDAIGLKWHKEG